MQQTFEARLAQFTAGESDAGVPAVKITIKAPLLPSQIGDLARMLDTTINVEMTRRTRDASLPLVLVARIGKLEAVADDDAPAAKLTVLAAIVPEGVGRLAHFLGQPISVTISTAQLSFGLSRDAQGLAFVPETPERQIDPETGEIVEGDPGETTVTLSGAGRSVTMSAEQFHRRVESIARG